MEIGRRRSLLAGSTDMDERIAGLIRLRDRLNGCIGCGCLSVDACPLRNPDDRLAECGAGAHYLMED